MNKKYIIECLSVEEFEELANDILLVRDSLDGELFKGKKDHGIDARAKDGEVIIQAKKWSSFSKLYQELEKEEIRKVKNLQPKRYILVVSLDLTVVQKEKIFSLFQGFIKKQTDLITGRDLRKYLGRPEYDWVLRKYTKIFLAKNVDALELIQDQSNSLLCESNFLKEIQKIKSYFVKTRKYEESLEGLIKQHVLFLTGDPGSGKTTNGKILTLELIEKHYAEEAYEIYSIDELIKQYNPMKKQIFFFDDFWGSSFLKYPLKGKEEQKLANYIEKIQNNQNTYLIITTREYVLAQGLRHYIEFQCDALNRRVFYKNCDYSEMEKIQILLAHLNLTDLDFEYKYAVLFYGKEIISNSNYSPRCIAYFLEQQKDTSLKVREFLKEFLDYLHSPKNYFKKIFYQLSEGAQIIAYLLSLSNPEIHLEDLKKTYEEVAKKLQDSSIKPSFFEIFLRELENSFTDYNLKEQTINFKNHSIHDFVNDILQEKLIDYEEAFALGVPFLNQIWNLLGKGQEKARVSSSSKKILKRRLMENFDSLETCENEWENFLELSSKNPRKYKKSSLIWYTFQRVEQEDLELQNFLLQQIDALYKPYQNTEHFYWDEDYTSFIDLVLICEKKQISLPKEKVVSFYFENCCYLYEYFYLTFLPKSYQDIIKKEAQKYKSKLQKNLVNRLKYELNLMSYNGIDMQYENTLEDLPKILKLLDIPYSNALKEVVKNCKLDYTSSSNAKPSKKRKSKVEKYLWEQRFNFIELPSLTKKEFLKMLEEKNISNHLKKRLKNKFYDQNNFVNLKQVNTKYLDFIIDFCNETNNIKLEEKRLPEFVRFLVKKKRFPKIEELSKYAYTICIKNKNYKSSKHFLEQYAISEKELQNFIDNGILSEKNKLVLFTEDKLYYYLVYYYLKKNKISYGEFLKNNDEQELIRYLECFDEKNFKKQIKQFLQELFSNKKEVNPDDILALYDSVLVEEGTTYSYSTEGMFVLEQLAEFYEETFLDFDIEAIYEKSFQEKKKPFDLLKEMKQTDKNSTEYLEFQNQLKELTKIVNRILKKFI